MPLRLLLLACALAPTLALAEEPPADAAPPAAAAPVAPAADAAAPPAEAAAAPVEGAPAPAASSTPPAPPPPAAAAWPRFGLALGAGFPQAATLDLMYRPLPWLRLAAGPSWGYAAWGLHGGLVVSPFRWAVSPTLGLEAGRFQEIDANRFAKSADVELQPLLRRVGVEYLSTTLGLEFGSQRGFAFSLRMGLAWLRIDSHGTGQLTGSGGTAGQNDAVITVTDPIVRASTPTVQLVCQYFL